MVNIDTINLENLSMKELADLKAKIASVEKVPAGQKAVALAAGLKAILAEIRQFDPEILGNAFEGITAQAMPKEAYVGKRYGLSETQIDNAKNKGAKLVETL